MARSHGHHLFIYFFFFINRFKQFFHPNLKPVVETGLGRQLLCLNA
jgi:hypothetical protein